MFSTLKVSYLIHLHIHTLFCIFIVAAVYVIFVLSNMDSITRDILNFSNLQGSVVNSTICSKEIFSLHLK